MLDKSTHSKYDKKMRNKKLYFGFKNGIKDNQINMCGSIFAQQNDVCFPTVGISMCIYRSIYLNSNLPKIKIIIKKR